MDRKIDYMRLLNDPLNRTVAERTALKSGIRADLKDYRYLASAAILYGNNILGFNDIYRKLGAFHNIKPASVMREVTYAINGSPDLMPQLTEMTGKKFNADSTNCEVIEYLALLYTASHKDAVLERAQTTQYAT